jgi:hypothetical protein
LLKVAEVVQILDKVVQGVLVEVVAQAVQVVQQLPVKATQVAAEHRVIMVLAVAVEVRVLWAALLFSGRFQITRSVAAEMVQRLQYLALL